MGLLNNEPIEIENRAISPKRFLEELFANALTLGPNDEDMTLLRIETLGSYNGNRCRSKLEMIDSFDRVNKITSMGRTTGFTLGISSLILVDRKNSLTGFLRPEEIFVGDLYQRLENSLKSCNICFKYLFENT